MIVSDQDTSERVQDVEGKYDTRFFMLAAPSMGRAVRFGMVGLGVAGIYTLCFALLAQAGATTLVANILAYAIAILFQFVGHRHFTFRATGPVGRSAMRFMALNGVGFLVSTAMALLLRDALGLGALATGAVISVTLAAVNWVVMQMWVFRT